MNNMTKHYMTKRMDGSTIFFEVHHKGLEAAIKEARCSAGNVWFVSGDISNDPKMIELVWSFSKYIERIQA